MRRRGRNHRLDLRIKLLVLIGVCAGLTIWLSDWMSAKTGYDVTKYEMTEQKAAVSFQGTSQTLHGETYQLLHVASERRNLSDMEKQRVEQWLPGVMAAQIAPGFGKGPMAAQAVIARSFLYWLLEHEESETADAFTEDWWAERNIIVHTEETVGTEVFSRYQEAVADTKGLVLMQEGEVILPLYHVCNGGTTRPGENTGPDTQEDPAEGNTQAESISELNYVSVESGMDLLVENSLRVIWLTPEDFAYVLSETVGETITAERLGLADGISEEELWAERDAAGYVKKIFLAEGFGTEVTELNGQQMANLLGIPSTHYEWAFCDGKYRFTCRGVGHGYGFSQWGAQALYEQGYSWEKLLDYYFPQTEIVRL